MERPLVSVVCLCYNQQQFVREAVESVLNQRYPNVQLIVVDDASTDGSASVIQELKREYPSIEILLLERNLGNCAAFNRGLALAKGKYVIDLAADDVLFSNRIAMGVERLEVLGEKYGVHYSDALLVNESGEDIKKHSENVTIAPMPSGNIYEAVIKHYFICSPTMLMRKKVLDELGGYDETLHYEDFDFLVRSSRDYWYDYSTDVLVKKRVVKGSLSDVQFRKTSDHWKSTWRVLEKVKKLNRNAAERLALRKRVGYEMGYHLKRYSFKAVYRYLRLLL